MLSPNEFRFFLSLSLSDTLSKHRFDNFTHTHTTVEAFNNSDLEHGTDTYRFTN